MKSDVLTLDTSDRTFVNLTPDVEGFASDTKSDGLLQVFLPHATAGIALIETGSGTEQDLEAAVERLLPRDDVYTHSHGSKGHGADHVLPAFIAPSVTLPVVGGRVLLGTWQSIVLVDTNRDNPRREVRLSFLPG